MWFSGFHNRVILGLLGSVGLFAALAYGGQSSVPITPGAGVNMGVVTTATGSDVSMHAVCDGGLGQPCATVNNLNELLVAAGQSGTWNVGVTGTVTTSPSGNTPITGSVGITGTVSVSPTGTTPVSPTGTTNVICLSGCSAPTGGTDITKWATTPLSSATTYGTPPATTATVANVNAFVTSGTISVSGGVTVLNANANGQAAMANSSPVAIASNQSTISTTTIGTVSVSPTGTTNVICLSGCSAPVGGTDITKWATTALSSAFTYGQTVPSTAVVGSVNAFITSGVASVTVGNVNSNGQATMANSSPIVIASDQSTISTTTIGTVSVSPTGTTNVICLSGCTSAVGGTDITKWATTSLSSAFTYGQSVPSTAVVGSVNAFITSGTISVSGGVTVLNANANGQTTMSGSSPVAIASNQSAIAHNNTQWASSNLSSATTWSLAPAATAVVPNVNAYIANTSTSAVNTSVGNTVTISTANSTAPVGIVGTVTVSTANSTAPVSIVGTPTVNANANSGFTATVGNAVPTSAIYEGVQARSSEQTAGANGNLIGTAADLVGKLIISPYSNKENYFTSTLGSVLTSTTSVSMVPALGAGVVAYITGLSCYNQSAATSTSVTFQTGTSPIFKAFLAVNGNFQQTFPTPIASRVNSNTLVWVQSGSAVAAGVICNINGYSGT